MMRAPWSGHKNSTPPCSQSGDAGGEIASAITLVTFAMSLIGASNEPAWFTGLVSFWLWLTVIFATFAEALAEGRGKARAASLRKTRTEIPAKRLAGLTAPKRSLRTSQGTTSWWRRGS
jgi:high-affinity K+ transport system ATPase subunit B